MTNGRAKNYKMIIHFLDPLLSIQKYGVKDIEVLRNFPNAKRILTVIILPGVNTPARYSSFADDVTVFFVFF